MILTSHILFGAAICLALRSILRARGIRSPPSFFYPFTLFMMEFPDIDHLYWMRIELRQIIPFTIWDLFNWELRIVDNPLNFLHYWIYPIALLALLALPIKALADRRWYVLGAFLGWAIHLILDGVVHLV